MSTNIDEARASIDALRKRSPDALRLARIVSLATRVEPELLRRVRLRLLTGVDVGAEADLWFSPLVQSSTPLAFTFIPTIADLLRRELAEGRESLQRAWEVLQEIHENAPAAIKLEERITWRVFAGEPDAYDEIEKELMSVVSAIVTQNRTGLARWALRALPRLPEEVRQTKAAQTLLLTAAAHLGAWQMLGKEVENKNLSPAFISDLKVVLPQNLLRVEVGVRLLIDSERAQLALKEGEYIVEFSSPPVSDTSDLIQVPGTVPLLLEVSWNEDAGPQVKQVSLYRGRVATVTSRAPTVTIRTAGGDVYTLSEERDKTAEVVDLRAAARSRLPSPPSVGYVRRQSELGTDTVRELKESLAPGTSNVVHLWGPRGVGKTTVASEAARELVDAYDGRVVWLSAEGRSDFSLTSLLDGVATQLGQTALRTLAVKAKSDEVRSLVNRSPTIILVDDLEGIRPKERSACFNFLQSCECAAVIISSQEIPQSHPQGVTFLPAMSRDEAAEFLKRIIGQRPEMFGGSTDAPDLAAADFTDEVISLCQGNPLAMQLLLALVQFTRNQRSTFEEMSKSEGDPLLRVFRLSFNAPELGDDGRGALMALALFVPSASRNALSEVAGLGKNLERLDDVAKKLTRLKLAYEVSDGKRLAVDGFVRGEVQTLRVSRLPNFKSDFVEYFVDYAEDHHEATAADYDALEAELENLLDAIDFALELQRWDLVIQLCVALDRFLDVRGYWDEALRRNEQAQRVARKANRRDILPKLNETAGEIYLRRGEFSKAEKAFRDVLRYYARQPLSADVANATRRLGSIALEQEDLKQAESLYSESLAISRQLQLDTGIADNLHNLAIVAQVKGDLNKALSLYEESLRISERLGDQRSIAISQHQLGVIAREQGRYDEARSFFEQSLNTKRLLGDRSGMADTLHQLGLLLKTLGDRKQAATTLRGAVTIYEQLGSPAAAQAREDFLSVTTIISAAGKQQRPKPKKVAAPQVISSGSGKRVAKKSSGKKAAARKPRRKPRTMGARRKVHLAGDSTGPKSRKAYK